MNKYSRIGQVLFYYLIAVGLSMFFRVPKLNPEWYLNLVNYQFGWVLISLLRASGPLVGGILSIWLFRNLVKRTITLSGTSLAASLLYFGAPVFMVTILGISGNSGVSTHLFGLESGLTIMVYCLFEETGWRGFLLDAMRHMANPLRFIIIGILWYVWHLNFLSGTMASLKFGLMIHLPACIFGSWIISFMADKYKSILVAAGVHSVFNVFFDLQTDLLSKLIIEAGVFLIWIATSYFVDKKKNKAVQIT